MDGPPTVPRKLRGQADGLSASVLDMRLPNGSLERHQPAERPSLRTDRWRKNFSLLIEDDEGLKAFGTFLASDEHMRKYEDHLNFWLAVRGFRDFDDPLRQQRAARQIYKQFKAKVFGELTDATQKELRSNFPKQPKQDGGDVTAAKALPVSVFDNAFKEISYILGKGPYQGFLVSQQFHLAEKRFESETNNNLTAAATKQQQPAREAPHENGRRAMKEPVLTKPVVAEPLPPKLKPELPARTLVPKPLPRHAPPPVPARNDSIRPETRPLAKPPPEMRPEMRARDREARKDMRHIARGSRMGRSTERQRGQALNRFVSMERSSFHNPVMAAPAPGQHPGHQSLERFRQMAKPPHPYHTSYQAVPNNSAQNSELMSNSTENNSDVGVSRNHRRHAKKELLKHEQEQIRQHLLANEGKARNFPHVRPAVDNWVHSGHHSLMYKRGPEHSRGPKSYSERSDSSLKSDPKSFKQSARPSKHGISPPLPQLSMPQQELEQQRMIHEKEQQKERTAERRRMNEMQYHTNYERELPHDLATKNPEQFAAILLGAMERAKKLLEQCDWQYLRESKARHDNERAEPSRPREHRITGEMIREAFQQIQKPSAAEDNDLILEQHCKQLGWSSNSNSKQ